MDSASVGETEFMNCVCNTIIVRCKLYRDGPRPTAYIDCSVRRRRSHCAGPLCKADPVAPIRRRPLRVVDQQRIAKCKPEVWAELILAIAYVPLNYS